MDQASENQQQHPVAGAYDPTAPALSSTIPIPIPNPGNPQPQTLNFSYQPAAQNYYLPAAQPQPQPQPQPHQQQHQELQSFWANQMQETEQTTDFKNHSLPLARIKKIMKADEDVRMIAAEAPVVFAKACEMFVLELTLRSWLHTEENKRRTLQKNDIAAAISRTDVFDFLVDVIPRDEFKEDCVIGGGGGGVAKSSNIPLDQSGGHYYYVAGQNQMNKMEIEEKRRKCLQRD